MQKRRGTQGFTLMEVLIVIAIIGILTTIAIPILHRDMPRRYLKATSRDMYSALMKAKSEAIMRRTPVAVRINPEKDDFKCDTNCNWLQGLKDDDRISYVMFTVPQGISVKGTQVKVEDSQFIEKNILPSGVVFADNSAKSKFKPNGPREGVSLYYHTMVFDERGIPKQLAKNEPKSAQGCVALCADPRRTRQADKADLTTCRLIKIKGGGAVSLVARGLDRELPEDDKICKQ